MKKIILCLLTLSLCIVFSACGKSSSPIEDFTYEFEDGEVTITGYLGSDLEIVIPNIIEERPVTKIDEKAFEGYDMTSIILSDNIQLIGDSAFFNCDNLTSIDIPDSVKNIGWGAFLSCDKLNSITIPERVENIGSWALGYISQAYGGNKMENFEIHGKAGSEAEKYANENNLAFIAE